MAQKTDLELRLLRGKVKVLEEFTGDLHTKIYFSKEGFITKEGYLDDENIEILSDYSFELDENNNRKYEFYKSNDEYGLNMKKINTYDSYGNIIESKIFSNEYDDEELSEVATFECDAQNQLIRFTLQNIENGYKKEIKFVYNEKGIPTETTQCFYDSETCSTPDCQTYQLEYEFDNQNNWIKQILRTEKEKYTTYRTFEYYE